MTTRDKLQAEGALATYTRRHKRQTVAGALGNNAGTVEHATRANWVYVRLHGDANQVILAYCGVSIPLVLNLVVTLERVERKAAAFYQVLGIAENIIYVDSDAAGVPGSHATQHQRRDRAEGGFDPLDVYTRAMVNLRGIAQAVPNLTVYVERGFYNISAVKLWAGGSTVAFTPPTDIGAWRFDLVYLGDDDALHSVAGTESGSWGGVLPAYPDVPASAIPICYVLLSTGQTAITEADIDDARIVAAASQPATSPPTPHAVLSASHSDTLAAAVVAGDVLIGNATPKWARLAAGALNTVLKMGAALPAWAQVAFSELTGALGVGQHGTLADGDHSGDMTGNARVAVRKNSGADVGKRRRLNLIEGANVTLTVADDAGDEEVDVTIASAGGGGALAAHDHSGDAGDGGTFDAANLTSGAATDGHVLTADGAGGAAWEAGGAGGGAPAAAKYVVSAAHADLSAEVIIPGFAGDPDIAGAAGAGTSEEYDTATTGLTWSPSTPATVNSNTTFNSHLYIASTDSTERFGTKAWAPGAGAFDVRCKSCLGTTGSSAGSLGLLINNNDNSVQLLLNWGVSAGGFYISAYTYAGGSYTQRGSNQTIGGELCYLRITRDGSDNVSFYSSVDGIAWRFIVTQNIAITVANVGFRSANNPHEGAIDWLRTSV